MPDCRLPIALLLCLVAPSAAGAQDEAARAMATLTKTDGKTVTGLIESISGDGVVLSSTQRAAIAIEDVLRIDVDGRVPKPPRTGPAVFLANNDRLAADVLRMDTDSLVCRWPRLSGRPTVKVPLETIRGFVEDLPKTAAPRRRLTNAVFQGRAESDLLILRNGDEVTGELTGLDDASFSLDSAAGPKQVERVSVRAASMNAALISFPPLPKRRALVMLADGSRLTAESIAVRDDTLSCALPFGATLEVSLSDLASLQFFSERVIPLSELEPAEYRFTPFLSGEWRLQRDRSVAGGPLLLGGREFGTGLGTHSRCRVVYDLAGNYRRFQSLVGINSAAGDKGSATVSVLVDGKLVFDGGEPTARSEPQQVAVDVAGAKTLTLVVDFGAYGDVQDHVDWCDALLIR